MWNKRLEIGDQTSVLEMMMKRVNVMIEFNAMCDRQGAGRG